MDMSRNQDQKNPEQSFGINQASVAANPVITTTIGNGGNRIMTAPLSHPGSFINASSGGEEQLSFNLTEDELLMNQ